MTFWDHLDELRSVLLKSLAAWVVGTIASFLCKDWLFAFLMRPLGDRQLRSIDWGSVLQVVASVLLWFLALFLYGSFRDYLRKHR